MGFFSKIFKGLKKAVKSIGRGISKAVKSVGKFVGKLGIVGQIGLMLVLPGLGGLLSKATTALLGSSNSLLYGVGKVLSTAGKFMASAKNVFSTVTEGVTGFFNHVGRGVLNNLGLNVGGPETFAEGWKIWTESLAENSSKILDPFKEVSKKATESLITKPDVEGTTVTVDAGIEKAIEKHVPSGSPAAAFDPFEGVIKDPFEASLIERPATLQEELLSLLDPENIKTAVKDTAKSYVIQGVETAISNSIFPPPEIPEYGKFSQPQFVQVAEPIQQLYNDQTRQGLNYGNINSTLEAYSFYNNPNDVYRATMGGLSGT